MSFEVKYDRDGQPLTIDKQNIPAEQAVIQPPIPQEPEMAEAIAEDAGHDVMSQPEPIQEAKVAQEFKVSQENQRNIKYMRERAEQADRLERERDELARKLAESQYKTAPQEENYDLGLGDNDLAEGKHLSKVQKEILALKKELNQYKQQTATQVAETKIRTQYPDFDKIVSKENVAALQAQYPELHNALTSTSDLYTLGVSAYTMIKKLGIAQEEVYNSVEKMQAMKNLAKPRPLASLSPQQGDSPLSNANAFANGLTEDLKKQLQKEMFAARNQI